MSFLERKVREQMYNYRRRCKRKYVAQKPKLRTFKILMGILCLMIGISLMMTQCSSKKESKNKTKTDKTALQQITDKTYYTYFEQFDINEEQLEKLRKLALNSKLSYAHTLSLWTVQKLSHKNEQDILKDIKKKQAIEQSIQPWYMEGCQLYGQFIYDIKYFPVARGDAYTYQNSWQKELQTNQITFKGITLVTENPQDKEMKVVSMIKGRIEKVGDTALKDYYVIIKSEGGAYFYYTHLKKHSKNLVEGDYIQSGDQIGLAEKVSIGVALMTKKGEEFWINPYYVLRYIEDKKS